MVKRIVVNLRISFLRVFSSILNEIVVLGSILGLLLKIKSFKNFGYALAIIQISCLKVALEAFWVGVAALVSFSG